jgi:hypothetical protein
MEEMIFTIQQMLITKSFTKIQFGKLSQVKILIPVLLEVEMAKYFIPTWPVISIPYCIHKIKAPLIRWFLMRAVIFFGLLPQIIAQLNI